MYGWCNGNGIVLMFIRNCVFPLKYFVNFQTLSSDLLEETDLPSSGFHKNTDIERNKAYNITNGTRV